MKKLLTESILDRMVRLREDGLPISIIAKRYGLHSSTVFQAIRRAQENHDANCLIYMCTCKNKLEKEGIKKWLRK